MKAKAILITALLCAFAGTAHAQWDGSGTGASPYLIKTTDDLVTLATNSQSNTYNGKFFRLENDLDMSGVSIERIGNRVYLFAGTFDGNGHVIRNLTISKPNANCVGLFGAVDATCTIKNLIIDGASITGYSYVGILVGDISNDGGTIENCFVVNSSVTYINTSFTYAGIIIGCYARNNFTLSGNSYYNCSRIINGKTSTINIATAGGDQPGAAQGIAIWTALQAAFDAASTDANNPTTITLAGNVTASGSDSYLLLSGNRHVVLDLNGHTLSRGLTAATSNGYVIGMANGSLTIRDSGTGGTITGGYSTGNIGCIAVSTNATLTLESGTISGNRITNQGGSAINCSGTVYMTGGTITGNTANTGRDGYEASDLNMCGAIYFSGSSGAALYMSGGSITGNRCGRTTAGAAGITSHLGIGSASVHLSGNYNISGNEQGTYNRATGEWTDLTPSDIHNSPRLGIRIDGPVSPAAPARLILNGSTGGHRETFTSGWSTYMGSADPEDYFTLDPASGFGIGIVGGEAHVGTLHTITLADGLTASVTSAAQGKSVTLGGAAASVTTGRITYATYYIVSYNDGTTDHADRYAADAQGNATFLMPDADVTVSSETVGTAVAYIDEDGNEQNCTDFTVISSSYVFGDDNGIAILGVADNTERWYAVVGTVSLDKPLFVYGNARLILCDGAALNINADNAIAFYRSNYLITIYGQGQGSGTLSVTNTGLAILVEGSGGLTINGGTLVATSENLDGIRVRGSSGITINGGTVSATGSDGINIHLSTLTQNGGILNASGTYIAGISANSATVNILGGTLNATGTSGAYGIYAIVNDIDDATVTLGWTNPDDRITASSIYLENDTTQYSATLQVRDGQTLTDGEGGLYSGTYVGDFDGYEVMAGKTLRPYLGAGAAAVTARKASFAGVERYWTTFYSATRYALPAGAQAFIMKSDHVLYRIGDGSVIPAGCAVVIMADVSALTNPTATGGIVTLTETTAAEPSVSGNILLGVDSPTAAPSGAHVMSKVGSDFGFFTFTGTIPANKAYYVE